MNAFKSLLLGLALCATTHAVSLDIQFLQDNWKFGLHLRVVDPPTTATFYIDDTFWGGGGHVGFNAKVMPANFEDIWFMAPGTHTITADLFDSDIVLTGEYTVTAPIGPRPVGLPESSATLGLLIVGLISLMAFGSIRPARS